MMRHYWCAAVAPTFFDFHSVLQCHNSLLLVSIQLKAAHTTGAAHVTYATKYHITERTNVPRRPCFINCISAAPAPEYLTGERQEPCTVAHHLVTLASSLPKNSNEAAWHANLLTQVSQKSLLRLHMSLQ